MHSFRKFLIISCQNCLKKIDGLFSHRWCIYLSLKVMLDVCILYCCYCCRSVQVNWETVSDNHLGYWIIYSSFFAIGRREKEKKKICSSSCSNRHNWLTDWQSSNVCICSCWKEKDVFLSLSLLWKARLDVWSADHYVFQGREDLVKISLTRKQKEMKNNHQVWRKASLIFSLLRLH